MLFKDSCVMELDEFGAIEESTAIPTAIFPAYVGGGNMAMGIDASGLQSLNNKVLQNAFGAVDCCGDLYVLEHGRMGDVLTERNALPYGYLSWRAEINGQITDGSNLINNCCNFKRIFSMLEGKVTTSMLINYFAYLKLEVTMPIDKNSIIIDITITPNDYEKLGLVTEKPIDSINFSVLLNQTTRDKKLKLYDKNSYSNNVLSTSVIGYKNYNDKIYIFSENDAVINYKDDALSCNFKLPFNKESKKRIVISFNNKITLEESNKVLEENTLYRKNYFSKICSINGISKKEAFLFNNCHHLFISGFDMKKGMPIGMPFNLPKWWRCSTFWDSHFVIDGIMRSNIKEKADEFVKFLFSALGRDYKPFPWMFSYDGKSTVEEGKDIAPLVMCAHAMTAIKHYEYFLDENILKNYGYEIIEAVVKFGTRYLFSKNEKGKFILSMPVSNDVVENEAVEVNHTFTAVWFLSIFAKKIEYDKILNKPYDEKANDIVNNFYLEHNDEEYFHCKNTTALSASSASWLPFLLYPTEATNIVDKNLLAKTRQKYTYEYLYMLKQGSYQPWTEFMQANSDMRLGYVEEGYRLRQLGLTHAFGLGLFSEIGPRQQTVAMPPYISAHGTYMTSHIFRCVSSDIWENKIGIFTGLAKIETEQDISIKNAVCAKGITVSASLQQSRLQADISCIKPIELDVELRIPKNLMGKEINLKVNDKSINFKMISQFIISVKIFIESKTTLILS